MYDEDENFEFERDRQTLTSLLIARGERHAAAIVAVSDFRSSYVGGFCDDGGLGATLYIPPELYDRARLEFREQITAAPGRPLTRHFATKINELSRHAQVLSK